MTRALAVCAVTLALCEVVFALLPPSNGVRKVPPAPSSSAPPKPVAP